MDDWNILALDVSCRHRHGLKIFSLSSDVRQLTKFKYLLDRTDRLSTKTQFDFSYGERYFAGRDISLAQLSFQNSLFGSEWVRKPISATFVG